MIRFINYKMKTKNIQDTFYPLKIITVYIYIDYGTVF